MVNVDCAGLGTLFGSRVEDVKLICVLLHVDAMDVIVDFIKREDEPLAHIAASVLWALAPAAHARNIGNCMGAIKHLLALLKQSFAVRPAAPVGELQLALTGKQACAAMIMPWRPRSERTGQACTMRHLHK